MNKRKKLLYWAGGICVFIAIFYLYSYIALINNLDGFTDSLIQELSLLYTAAEIEIYMQASRYMFIASAIYNIIVAAICFIFAMLKNHMFVKHKGWITLSVILGVILGLNLISWILMLRVLWIDNVERKPGKTDFEPDTNIHLSQNNLREQLKLKNMADKIAILKHLRNEGSITEAEYNQLLNEIISLGVQDKL